MVNSIGYGNFQICFFIKKNSAFLINGRFPEWSIKKEFPVPLGFVYQCNPLFPPYTTPSPSHHRFASQRPLLAVIFRCENAPDSQTGFEPGISQNNSAVFSRMRDIWGVGNPSWEDSLRRRSGAGKRAGSLPVLWGILDPHNRPFSRFSPAPAHLIRLWSAGSLCERHLSGL